MLTIILFLIALAVLPGILSEYKGIVLGFLYLFLTALPFLTFGFLFYLRIVG